MVFATASVTGKSANLVPVPFAVVRLEMDRDEIGTNGNAIFLEFRDQGVAVDPFGRGG